MPVPGGIEVRGQRGAVEVIGRDPVRALVEDATGAGSGVGLLGQPPAVTVTETSFQGTPVGMTPANITEGLTNNDIGSSPASATANGLDNLPSEFDAAQDNFVDLVADENVAAGFGLPYGGLKPSATYPAQVRVAWNNFVTGTSRFGQLVYQLQEQAPAMPVLSMMFASSILAAGFGSVVIFAGWLRPATPKEPDPIFEGNLDLIYATKTPEELEAVLQQVIDPHRDILTKISEDGTRYDGVENDYSSLIKMSGYYSAAGLHAKERGWKDASKGYLRTNRRLRALIIQVDIALTARRIGELLTTPRERTPTEKVLSIRDSSQRYFQGIDTSDAIYNAVIAALEGGMLGRDISGIDRAISNRSPSRRPLSEQELFDLVAYYSIIYSATKRAEKKHLKRVSEGYGARSKEIRALLDALAPEEVKTALNEFFP